MIKILLILSLIFCIGCSNSNSKEEKYSFIRGINLYQKGKKKDALKEYKKAYEINPKNIVVVKEIAFLSYELGDINSAIDFYEKAHKLDPTDKDVVKNLVNLYYSKGDLEKSRRHLEEISDIKDDDILKLKRILLDKKLETN